MVQTGVRFCARLWHAFRVLVELLIAAWGTGRARKQWRAQQFAGEEG